jgi:ribonucleoside-triphosphate reductase
MGIQSPRAHFVEHRTYLRPRVDGGDILETPSEALDRQIGHQRYLWENAKRARYEHLLTDIDESSPLEHVEIKANFEALAKLSAFEEEELDKLHALLASHKASLSGRVRWMAGTDVIKERPSAAFNCSFSEIKLPADLVDAFWLLLQGCGVGFRPVTGMLTGFAEEIPEVVFVGSTRDGRGGQENTVESYDPDTRTWTIVVGDSAKAWAKLIGKLTAGKYRARKIVLDFSNLRPAGQRLRGYGWISSGWEPLRDGMKIVIDVLNAKAGKVLNAVDILDIVNALGTVLSSRRSAQIALLDADHPDADIFVKAKDGYWPDRKWRAQSNNSLTYMRDPTRQELEVIFKSIWASGDPGFYNMEHAKRRAPWAEGTNPCGEIILPSKGFCNLVNILPHRFETEEELREAVYLMARANFRQTCVSMRDGVLQIPWDDNNKLLRLCGVSLTGYVQWEHADDEVWLEKLRGWARDAADSMADDLSVSRSALVTQVQPSGTGSKALGHVGDEVKEGAHNALSQFIFNWIGISKFDPLVEKARRANYKVIPHPSDQSSVLIAWPVEYSKDGMTPTLRKRTKVEFDFATETEKTVEFEETIYGNLEPAVLQLERYKTLMKHYVDHNCSITVFFDEEEIPTIIDWLLVNWSEFVGVSFLQRTDPTKTAADFGQPYLPQEPVFESDYRSYVEKLLPIDWSDDNNFDGVDDPDCATGVCPVR